MSSLYEAQRQYALDNPKPTDASSWDQMCGSLMYRFNSSIGWGKHPVGNISSAYRVAIGSAPLNTNAAAAPIGAWHYFDIAGPNNGHVIQDGLGGGSKCLSTGYAVDEQLGKAIGFVSVQSYVRRKGARYMGWATNYSGGLVNPNYLASTSGGDITPIEEEVPMPALIRHPNGSIGFVSDGGELDAISDLNEVNAIIGVGLVPKWIDTTPYIWDLLTNRTARLKMQNSAVDVDESAIAASIVPLLVPAVLQGLKGVGSGLTESQVKDAAESAIRAVFADAASK